MPLWTSMFWAVCGIPCMSLYVTVSQSDGGTLFHTEGLATENARSPSLVRLHIVNKHEIFRKESLSRFRETDADLAVVFTWTWLHYVGSLLSQFRLSVVCNVGAPYSGVETFGNISSPLCTVAILWPLRGKFNRGRPRRTCPSGALNARGVAK